MKSENIESLIKNIQLRPKMYLEDLSIKNLYFFLSGYICASNQSSDDVLSESKKIDSIFHSEFTKRSKSWILLH
ncbi:hypothetical protein [uncultured Vagococcus sp.]|uniref:hypothetical protein n=1 Tax=uncultured Vagococcus sp. TaxID=189676 RepID=UPI0028D742AE|nr:hypothetical protein [uncultured Vagococcus sp.]